MTFEEWFQAIAGVDDLKDTFREAWDMGWEKGIEEGYKVAKEENIS